MFSSSAGVRSLSVVLLLAWTGGAARGQHGELAEKLKQANIRVRTAHYALAGSVNEKTLRDYGQLLEFVHHEYTAGFGELVQDDAQSQAGRSAGGRAAGKASPAKAPAGTKRGDAARRNTPPPADPNQPATDPNQSAADPNAAPNDAQAGTLDQEQSLFRVLIFGTANEYREFTRAYLGAGAEHTIGMYVSKPPVLMILDQGNPDSTAEVLFHEAFHQFMDRFVKDPPMWLNEGLACYYGDARPGRRGLTFDHPRVDRWKLCRKLIEKNIAFPLHQVVGANRAQFYDESPVDVPRFERVTQRDCMYAEAYTLIHTLLADNTGRERLRNYVRELAHDDGKHTAKITADFFDGAACEHMTPFWVKHVQSRPETR